MKNNNGLTLVALTVTIIILIILAGISINLVIGDNGIITIAKKTKENIELAKIEEETELNELYTQLETNGGSSDGTTYDAIAKLTEFKTAIANAIEEAGGIKPDITAETSVFADNIKGIVKEVTKNATATADNISEGKTAWVEGKLIVGNGSDNKTYMEQNIASMGYVKIIYLGTGNSFDVTSYANYQDFDTTNFIVEPNGNISSERQAKVGTSDARAAGNFTFSKEYNNGVLNISSVVYADNINGNTSANLGSSPKKNITYKCYLILK